MARRAKVLGANVHLHNEDGSVTVYEAGSTPDEVGKDAAKITNESAWVESEEEEPQPKTGRRQA